MINVNIKLINRSDNRIVASGYYKKFDNIDDLIQYCTERSNHQFIVDYEIIEKRG